MHYFTIVRHGQTHNNVRGIIQSRTGGELTEHGKNMAKSLGKHLKDESFTRIFSSDAHRCRQTTQGVLSQIIESTPAVTFTRALRERDNGDWEFLPSKVIRDKMAETKLPFQKFLQLDYPNGESFEECSKRAEGFFSEICAIVDATGDDENPENILAVSHGMFIMVMLDYIRGSPSFQVKHEGEIIHLRRGMENTCRSRFAIRKIRPGDDSGKREIIITHLFNTDHLAELQDVSTVSKV